MHNVLKPPMLKPKPSIVGWVYPCIESKKWNRNKTFIVVVYIKTIVKKKLSPYIHKTLESCSLSPHS